jgi:hypothetical protein
MSASGGSLRLAALAQLRPAARRVASNHFAALQDDAIPDDPIIQDIGHREAFNARVAEEVVGFQFPAEPRLDARDAQGIVPRQAELSLPNIDIQQAIVASLDDVNAAAEAPASGDFPAGELVGFAHCAPRLARARFLIAASMLPASATAASTFSARRTGCRPVACGDRCPQSTP